MNAKALGALLVGNTSRLRTQAVTLALALVLLAVSAACSGIGAGNQVPSAAGASANRNCADLWMQDIVASAAVSGVFACQDPNLQALAQSAGVNDDNGVHQILASSDGGSVSFIGADGRIFVYAVKDAQGTAIWIIRTDPDGKIAHFEYTHPE